MPNGVRAPVNRMLGRHGCKVIAVARLCADWAAGEKQQLVMSRADGGGCGEGEGSYTSLRSDPGGVNCT